MEMTTTVIESVVLNVKELRGTTVEAYYIRYLDSSEDAVDTAHIQLCYEQTNIARA